jgi:hypothetical protein
VPETHLNLLDMSTLGDQQTGAGMAKIMEPQRLELRLFHRR